MHKKYQVTAYLSIEARAALETLSRGNNVSMSEQLALLVTTAAEGHPSLKSADQKIYDALQHIAIGVDALLKFGPDARAFEAAKEARQRRLKGAGDGR